MAQRENEWPFARQLIRRTRVALHSALLSLKLDFRVTENLIQQIWVGHESKVNTEFVFAGKYFDISLPFVKTDSGNPVPINASRGKERFLCYPTIIRNHRTSSEPNPEQYGANRNHDEPEFARTGEFAMKCDCDGCENASRSKSRDLDSLPYAVYTRVMKNLWLFPAHLFEQPTRHEHDHGNCDRFPKYAVGLRVHRQ